jgi:CRP-like cAMP-binding protein
VDGSTVGGIRQESFFGEMSLLTGEPRRATVRASREVWLAEVTKELMEPLLRANPAVMEILGTLLADRERRTRESAGGSKVQAADGPRREDYLARLKQFFGL